MVCHTVVYCRWPLSPPPAFYNISSYPSSSHKLNFFLPKGVREVLWNPVSHHSGVNMPSKCMYKRRGVLLSMHIPHARYSKVDLATSCSAKAKFAKWKMSVLLKTWVQTARGRGCTKSYSVQQKANDIQETLPQGFLSFVLKRLSISKLVWFGLGQRLWEAQG